MPRPAKKDTGSGANWMDTYGDLVTLLLTFFVLLFAFSSMDQAKWEKLVEVFTGSPPQSIMEPIDPSMPIEGLAIDDVLPSIYMKDRSQEVKVEEPQPDPGDGPNENKHDSASEQEQEKIRESILELTEALKGYVDENQLQGVILVEEKAEIVYVTMQEGALFDSGRADIKPEGQVYLKDIGDIVKQHTLNDEVRMINAVGHTDSNPISTAQFKDNLELSNERAAETIRFLSSECDIPPSMFTSWGRSEWDPLADNSTPEGRRKNRRVELRIVSQNADLGDLFA